MHGQGIQLHFAEGISDSTRRQWGGLKYAQVCLLIGLFIGLSVAVPVGTELED